MLEKAKNLTKKLVNAFEDKKKKERRKRKEEVDSFVEAKQKDIKRAKTGLLLTIASM